MRKACRVLVRSLSNLLNYQDFLSIQSKLANTEFEPLGVGITNLAYWHARKSFKYGEVDALAEVKRWMEHQAYFLTEMSVELAQERGPCQRSQYTYYGKGVFPWERRAAGVNELTDFTPSGNLDWEGLRKKLLQYGIRNATLMAVAPVESSSVVLNSTNGIEMPMEMISVKESKAGSFVQVVPEYHRLKNKYQMMWDQTDCVAYLKTSAVLAAYIDQSLSTNTFYNPAHFPGGKVPGTLIAKNLMLAYKWGLKTVYYSLINKVGAKLSVTATQSLPILTSNPIAIYTDEEDCEA
jgi:ribonucleoside-diphosphate reductase alpha chain